MICAIHQPNFFPWLGFFDKIAKTDVFVFLNQVDYEKSGHSMQSYTNRVAVLCNNNKVNIHCPVVREHGNQPIDKVRIKDDTDWRKDILSRLEEYYRKAPFFSETMDLLGDIFAFKTGFLSEFNINAIREICRGLGLSTKFVMQNELNVSGHSSELLAQITKVVGCDRYMFGGGGNKYQDDSVFEKHGIITVAQEFEHWVYNQNQNEEFVKGLSIIDALFWIGLNETGRCIRANK